MKRIVCFRADEHTVSAKTTDKSFISGHNLVYWAAGRTSKHSLRWVIHYSLILCEEFQGFVLFFFPVM